MLEVYIAICDDELIISEIISDKIYEILHSMKIYNSKIYNSKIDIYNDSRVLEKSGRRYDIIIMDIEMPYIDGLSLAKKMDYDESTKLIFLSGHQELMKLGFHVRAFRFLTKPVDDNEIREAIQSALKEIIHTDKIMLGKKDDKEIVYVEDIIFIESLGEGCYFHTVEKEYIDRKPLRYWLENLPELSFIQIHRSYVINLKFVQRLNANTVTVSNDFDLPVSVRKKKGIQEALYNYIKMKSKKMQFIFGRDKCVHNNNLFN